MSGVFICYRRDDSGGAVERIYDRLAGRFGADKVFLDREDIPFGVDYVEDITTELTTAAYVLVAIGPRWLTLASEEGERRLDDPHDTVRFEVRTALDLDRLVVPMLVDGTPMPDKSELPKDIRKVVVRNGIAVRPEPLFDSDMDDLMNGLSLDGVDRRKLPTPFNVGVVARHLGFGGGIGWAVIGLILGIWTLSTAEDPLSPLFVVAAFLAGGVAGWVGGAIVGALTGMLVREHSPPLVARRVRRMGLTWSFGVMAAYALAGGVATLIAWLILETDDSEGFEGLGALFLALLLGALIFVVVVVVGSAAIAASFARRFRLRADDLSRFRGVLIGVIWFLGSFLTFGVLIALMVGAESLLDSM